MKLVSSISRFLVLLMRLSERARMTQEVSRTNAENVELKQQLEELHREHSKVPAMLGTSDSA